MRVAWTQVGSGRVDWVELGAAGRFVVRSSLFIISIILFGGGGREGRRGLGWRDGGMEEATREEGFLIYLTTSRDDGAEGEKIYSNRCW